VGVRVDVAHPAIHEDTINAASVNAIRDPSMPSSRSSRLAIVPRCHTAGPSPRPAFGCRRGGGAAPTLRPTAPSYTQTCRTR
jgi:hypothetical protein